MIMLDYFEHQAFHGPVPEEPSMVKERFMKWFGRPVYFAKLVKLTSSSHRMAQQESSARDEACALDELYGTDPESMERIYGNETSQEFLRRRREELFTQGRQQLIEHTISYQLGSERFIGQLVLQADD